MVFALVLIPALLMVVGICYGTYATVSVTGNGSNSQEFFTDREGIHWLQVKCAAGSNARAYGTIDIGLGTYAADTEALDGACSRVPTDYSLSASLYCLLGLAVTGAPSNGASTAWATHKDSDQMPTCSGS